MSVKNIIGFIKLFPKWKTEKSNSPVKFYEIETYQPDDTKKLREAIAKFEARKQAFRK